MTTLRLSRGAASFAAATALLTAAAANEGTPAQLVAESDYIHNHPDTTAVTLQTLEVTANRADARTPIAFTNISGKEIEEANHGKDLPFLLQSAPSIVVTSDAGAGIGYSGIRVRGTDPSRINVTANGIPINDSESSRVYWVNMPDIASSLRDLQIQRGAGTSTNGAGAFGASINMVTDAPGFEPSAEITTSYGSYNTNRQTIKVATGRFADRWSADLRVSHIGSDGYIDRASSKLWSYMGQVAYQAPRASVRLLAFGGKERTYMAWDYASKEEMEKYGRRYNPCGKYTTSDGQTAFYSDQYDNFAQHHLQLIGAYRLADAWRLNAALHYTLGDGYYEQYKTKRTLQEYGLQPYLNAEGEKVKKSDLVRRKFVDNDFGGATVSLQGEFGPVRATYGAAANTHRGNHFGQVMWVRNYIGAIDPLQEYYRNRGRKTDANIFARHDIDILSGLSGYADLQLRRIHYTITGASDNFDWLTEAPAALDVHQDYTFFNPKAGLTYTHDAHRVYASWSVAHKEPVRDNFTDGDPGHYPSAERLFDYEAGWQYSISDYTASAGVYYMDYRDQLVLTGQLSDTGNPLSVNVPRSYRAGIELQSVWRPWRWLEWNVNATLSRSRIKDFTEYLYEDEWTNPITYSRGDTPISFSPDVVANNILSLQHCGWSASLASRYVSEQYMDNVASPEARLDAYCVSDLSAGYTFSHLRGIRALRLGVTVYNIFNAKYCNNGYSGAGYYRDEAGQPVIYRYAGFAAQAPTNLLGTISLEL